MVGDGAQPVRPPPTPMDSSASNEAPQEADATSLLHRFSAFVDCVSYERERCPMTGIENDDYSFSMQPM